MTAKGGFKISHGTDLHWRGVRTQQPAIGKIKRVVHGARRMIGGNVQRLEIVESRLRSQGLSRRESRLA